MFIESLYIVNICNFFFFFQKHYSIHLSPTSYQQRKTEEEKKINNEKHFSKLPSWEELYEKGGSEIKKYKWLVKGQSGK